MPKPNSQLTFLIASSISSHASLSNDQGIQANWSQQIFANRRLPVSERLAGKPPLDDLVQARAKVLER
jgi:hypothetical protein